MYVQQEKCGRRYVVVRLCRLYTYSAHQNGLRGLETWGAGDMLPIPLGPEVGVDIPPGIWAKPPVWFKAA